MKAAFLIACCSVLLLSSCDSPLALDVDRTKWYNDSATHPTRLSFYYYFGDSAYEAIVTDTSFLHEIWIERKESPMRLTIPQFSFELSDTIHATIDHTPLVRKFCFSTDQVPVDGYLRSCYGDNSWVDGEYLDQWYQRMPFHWMANSIDKKIMIAWFNPEQQDLIKGRLLIRVANPANPMDTATYNGLITLEW